MRRSFPSGSPILRSLWDTLGRAWCPWPPQAVPPPSCTWLLPLLAPAVVLYPSPAAVLPLTWSPLPSPSLHFPVESYWLVLGVAGSAVVRSLGAWGCKLCKNSDPALLSRQGSNLVAPLLFGNRNHVALDFASSDANGGSGLELAQSVCQTGYRRETSALWRGAELLGAGAPATSRRGAGDLRVHAPTSWGQCRGVAGSCS